ncbi:MAG: 2-amino-4-hydroxy-6-hydroxymethyldihydropteridine diphosphokinase [Lachnospiraceae bacterium]|nr:2-amino-4-hydroxy-6-hydroxymethyldihydropteridine diphosphokinase [Lachnospiraceae bacterium]
MGQYIDQQDFILIKNVEFFGYHGVYDYERGEGQRFLFSAKLFLDIEKPGETDELEDTVDYGAVTSFLSAYLKDHPFKLLEAAVARAMEEAMLAFPMLDGMELTLQKPEAPIDEPFETVSVTRQISWHDVYIGLGSNMGDKSAYLSEAVSAMKENILCRDVAVSKLLTTKPYGGVEQDDFLNGVLYMRTLMSPKRLLAYLQSLEEEAGRERKEHWGPRTLDLDILYYDDAVMDGEKLTIPHPDLQNRLFVLEPLDEIAPHLRHPLTHKTARQMMDDLR